MKQVLLVLSLMLPAVVGFGHGDHHSMDKSDVPGMAKTHISNLIAEKKLDAAWAVAVADKTEKKSIGGKSRWIVVFRNAKNSTLELTMTPAGKLVEYKMTAK